MNYVLFKHGPRSGSNDLQKGWEGLPCLNHYHNRLRSTMLQTEIQTDRCFATMDSEELTSVQGMVVTYTYRFARHENWTGRF